MTGSITIQFNVYKSKRLFVENMSTVIYASFSSNVFQQLLVKRGKRLDALVSSRTTRTNCTFSRAARIAYFIYKYSFKSVCTANDHKIIRRAHIPNGISIARQPSFRGTFHLNVNIA